MASHLSEGVWTALVTPFKPDLSIDWDAFEKQVDRQIKAGIAGIIPCGTTGESPTLTSEEKKELIQFCVKRVHGTSTQVIAGTGSNCTAETVALSAWASEAGVSGVLLVVPYYNKPSQAGLYAHFKAVADAVKCEVMLYNVPGRTITSLTAETIVRLAAHPRIRTIKEATGNLAFTHEILAALPANADFRIFSGDDPTYLDLLSAGASGVVSVASNLFPREMVELHRSFRQVNLTGARAIHDRFLPLFRDLFVEANPTPLKFAMERLGLGPATLRLPLAPIATASERTVENALQQCGLLPS